MLQRKFSTIDKKENTYIYLKKKKAAEESNVQLWAICSIGMY